MYIILAVKNIILSLYKLLFEQWNQLSSFPMAMSLRIFSFGFSDICYMVGSNCCSFSGDTVNTFSILC